VSILVKHLPLVKDQAEFHHKMMEKFGAPSIRGGLHKGTAEKFLALLDDLEIADKQLDAPHQTPAVPAPKKRPPMQLSLSLNEIDGLPTELISELSIKDADKVEFAILNAVEQAGGIITLDRLLIALYRNTKEIHKRNSLYSRLSRMASKNLIHYVPGKKGVYSTEQLSEAEALQLFGSSKDEDPDEEDELLK
jgi:hypothetical protein